jgi:fatty acid CoA ligase FadD36
VQRPAITVDGRSLTRAELLASANAVAEDLAGLGSAAPSGPRPVAIEATPTLETVVAVLGALLAGVPAVPVPPDAGPRERAHIFADSGAQPAPPVDVTVRSVRERPLPASGPALVLYTSGTTGPPKGAVLSHQAINACLDGLAAAWQWTPDDVLVHGLPLFHVHGLVLGVLGALRVGSPLVHTGRPTPEAYAAVDGSLYFGVPTVWSRIAADETSARALRRGRLLVSGSAGLPAPVFESLRARAGQGPVERYGMTETLITLAARADEPREPGWVGGPLDGVQARLVDEAGAPVEPGTIGLLHVRGTTLFDGYLNARAPLTDDGWFVTGDAAVQSPEGRFRIVGRAEDDLIKSGGYRIGAGEIEASLLAHPDVVEAAVVGHPDDDLGQRIVAYVVAQGVDAGTLIEHVARDLSVHKRPREVRFVEALPRNAMGKVQKSRLP